MYHEPDLPSPEPAPVMPAPRATPDLRWVIPGYVLMLAGCVGLFLLIRAQGESLSAPEARAVAPGTASGASAKGDVLLPVLVALAAVILVGQVLSKLFARIGQPPVIGEVMAGILLGPSLLGPEISALVLPPGIAPQLGVIAQLGVILYMFLVGLEMNAGLLRSHAHAMVMVAHASIAVPFLSGAGLALWLYPVLSLHEVPFTSFALFMGVAMSVTAFPVLARILADRGLEKTELGVLALGIAAVDDATAWCLLALVVGVTQSRLEGALLMMGLALGFVAFMFLVVRPLADRLARYHEQALLGRGSLALLLLAVLLSALAAEAIGIHAIFGAFLFGVMIRHDSQLAREASLKIHDLVTVLFLPAFFAYTGMSTQIRLVSGAEAWLLCGLIVLAATAGKFGGTFIASCLAGLNRRTSAALGILMNTRGLMELVVLNVGLDLGVISPTLFAMMVLMALTTTLATTPLLSLMAADLPVRSRL